VAPPPGARSRSWVVGAGAVLLGVSFGYSAGVVGPAAAPVSSDFDISLSAAGLLTSVYFIAIAAYVLFGPAVEERLGIVWSARAAATAVCLGGAVTAVSPWFGGVLAGRAVAGLGTGVALIAAPVIARATGSTFLLGVYGSGITVGVAAALFIGGELAEHSVDWRVNFVISAVVGASALPFFVGRFPDVGHARRVGAAGLRKLLLSASFWRADALFVFANGIPLILTTWLLQYLTIHHGIGAGAAGALGFLLFGLLGISRPVGGWLASSPSRGTALAVVGPALAAAALVALALDRTEELATVAVVVAAIGFGAPYALAYQLVEDLVEGSAELGLALALQGVNLLAILVIPLVGAALEHGYGRLTFLVLAAYCVFVSAVSSSFSRSSA
jgi:MFS family permease